MLNSFRDYWTSYGGFKAIFQSSYFWIALFITAISFTTWLKNDWHTIFIGVFPSLLGFSLAGYAIWLTLGDQRLKEILIKKKVNNISAFLAINASFVHFIILQVLAFIGLFVLHTNSINTLVDIINLSSCKLFYNVYLLDLFHKSFFTQFHVINSSN
ncbi:hypothetical protein [Acinetobacter sp. KS-LM10]|uniref:hypothetical protein n=1 Tax=Acinetobacter sp. KS-LM10 TaxID=3120518 RepID=UPI0030CBB6D7